jgi:hypothetical protein
MRPYVHSETVRLIVEDYAAGAPARAAEAAWWRADGLPFAALVERIGRADHFGKRHSHQRRITASALDAGTAALHAISYMVRKAPNFLELWFLVQAAFKPIYGLGELAVYDTAERLRHRLGLESEHVIYLHAGARVGARRLKGGRLPNESAWGILRHEVPEGFRHLSTHEIEDILCSYKDDLFLAPSEFRARRSGGRAGRCGLAADLRPTC